MEAERPTGRRGQLPELELECMKVLWEAGDLTVHGVRERLQPRRALAYTTVLTLLNRLARKGAAERRKRGRAHVYSAVYSRSAACEGALRRVVNHFFGGSREQLARYLAPAGVAAAPLTAAAGMGAPAATASGKGEPSLASSLDRGLERGLERALDPALL